MTDRREGLAVRGLVFGLLFAIPVWVLIAGAARLLAVILP